VGVVDDAKLVLALGLVAGAVPAAAGADVAEFHREVAEFGFFETELDRQHWLRRRGDDAEH
jgi:hypothetical protein